MYRVLQPIYTEKFTKHRYSFKNELLFPLPARYNVETQEALEVLVFNMWGGGHARQARLYSRLACVKKPKSANLSQDFCL